MKTAYYYIYSFVSLRERLPEWRKHTGASILMGASAWLYLLDVIFIAFTLLNIHQAILNKLVGIFLVFFWVLIIACNLYFGRTGESIIIEFSAKRGKPTALDRAIGFFIFIFSTILFVFVILLYDRYARH